ncbi:TIM barrel protein, partial [Staphylococcus epidermidis]|uniref:TIM barrel protein n=1 Tax=Staphylococcus epidermidis TaxID=1282 RepID=UPI0011AAE28C
FNLGVEFVEKEMERSEGVGGKDIVVDGGGDVGGGVDKGIEKIIEGVNEVVRDDNNVRIGVESMGGKGREVGRCFEEIGEIID